MTYNVFGGTLNPTLLLYHVAQLYKLLNYKICKPCKLSFPKINQTSKEKKKVLKSFDSSYKTNIPCY